ncbi:MAG: ABC transporter permease [Anaerolineae bacterium]|jgi:putative ABC transport system permease protein
MIFSRPTTRKVFGELTQHLSRTMLVVLSIAVGITAIGAIAGAFFVLPADMSSSYSASNPPNIELVTDPFDQGLADAITRMPDVADAEAQRWVSVRVQVASGDWRPLRIVAVDSPGATRINQLLPQAGASEPRDNELLLANKAAERLGLQPGGRATVELSDGALKQVGIAGVSMDLGGGFGAIVGTDVAYVTRDTLPWLGEPEDYNRLVLTVAGDGDDAAHIRAVADTVVDRLGRSGREVYARSEHLRSQHPLQNIISALLGVLGLLGLLVLFLSGALITNTLSALLAQQLRQVGIMKLVGGRRLQIASVYLWLVAIYALLALAIAVPLGAWAANGIARLAADIVNFPLSNPAPLAMSPWAVLIQATMGIGVPLLAAALPVHRGTRITVRRALASDMQQSEPRRPSRLSRWLDRAAWVPRILLISLRNTFRQKQRLALTLLTLTLGGSIFIGVLNAQAALDDKVEGIARYFSADVNLDMAQLYRIDRVVSEALQVPGVVSVEAWATAEADIVDADGVAIESATVLGPPAGSALVEPVILAGRWLHPDDAAGLAVNEAFLRRFPGLGVGSTLRLDLAGSEQDWTVVGVFEFTGMDELIAYANREPLATALGQHYSAAVYRITTTYHDLEFQQVVAANLDAHLKTRGLRVANAEAGRTFTDSTTEYVGILITVLLAMAGLTAAVGSIGLAGTLSMNVLERSREIGVLRAIGAYDRIIVGMVLGEGLLIGLLSFVGSSLLALPISYGLTQIISRSIFGSNATLSLSVHSFAIWFGLVVALASLASLLPAKNAARLTVREVLAYE